MHKLFLTFLGILMASTIFAQSNTSQPMSFHIEKEVLPPVLSVVPGSLTFVDKDRNNVIDANEECRIRFEVTNDGRGDAYGCSARVTATGSTTGLTISDVTLPTIPHGSKHWIEIPIRADERTETGEIALEIYVYEPNGYSSEKINYSIGTHKLRTPYVQVASYKVSGGKGGTLERRKAFTLQVVVQNLDQGTAENVTIGLQLPANFNWLGGDEANITLATLKPNETKQLEYELMANQNAAEENNLGVVLKERTGRYSKNASIPLRFGQHVGGTIAMSVERKDEDVAIRKASLVADVDENIPITSNKNTSAFVLIIANEHYQRVAPVPFALNDGAIFREYCMKTLGIQEKRIHYIPDATYNQIKEEVRWLKTITETFDDSKVIVYYAGHGIPDESSKTAYLLPIDGSGTDVSTGYKLDELYAALGNMPASRITVFMDACFSGSKREEGMLASARGVALKAKSGTPQGNMVVFSAAQGNETAYPNREKQHGLFTYYLLKKLQETEGNVSLQELGNYIITNVKQQSVLLNSKLQTPCVTPSSVVADSWQSWKLR